MDTLEYEHLWARYEAANTRSRMSYFQSIGHQRQLRDQSGRGRNAKQRRAPRSPSK